MINWKILVWTSPIWMMVECFAIGAISNSTYVPPPPKDPKFIDNRSLCDIAAIPCETLAYNKNDWPIVSEIHTPNARAGDDKRWKLPSEVLEAEEVMWVYFDLEGNYLGYENFPVDYDASSVSLEAVILLDTQNWFRNHVNSNMSDWVVHKNGIGYFEFNTRTHYVVHFENKVGVLKTQGGWVVEPTDQYNISYYDFKSCRYWVLQHPDVTEILDPNEKSYATLGIGSKKISDMDCSQEQLQVVLDGVEYQIPWAHFREINLGNSSLRFPEIAVSLLNEIPLGSSAQLAKQASATNPRAPKPFKGKDGEYGYIDYLGN